MKGRGSWLLTGAALLAAYAGCRTERAREDGDGVHPPGFDRADQEGSHAATLRRAGYPLGECRACHGDDYAGGAVGSSCVSSGCHTEGVEACGTCHLEEPITGAHAAHARALTCSACHSPRVDARHPDHPNGEVEVDQTGLAAAGGRSPSWSSESGTCANVYCHGGRERSWQEEGPLGCDDCHGAPPEGHARFADAESDCTSCHGGDEHHLDGVLDVADPGCDGCHGEGPLGAPPAGLLGVPAGGAVGAHARHLDATLGDRIAPIVPCVDCHDVPLTTSDEGHLDESAPADVQLRQGGDYDPAARTCVVACHGGRDPGPAWDDDSGAARECDGCHTMPPTTLASGAPHPPSGSSEGDCSACHSFSPETHVDGRLDVEPLGCDGCHGSGPLGAPPPGLDGDMEGGAVGSHVRHLDGTLLDRIGQVALCSDCHEVPVSVLDPGHIDQAPPADVRLRNGGVYLAPARSCVTGCHWDREPGPAWDDDSGAERACDACHAMPPPTTRIGTPHPPTAPDPAVCTGCHSFTPATHVDGRVDFTF